MAQERFAGYEDKKIKGEGRGSGWAKGDQERGRVSEVEEINVCAQSRISKCLVREFNILLYFEERYSMAPLLCSAPVPYDANIPPCKCWVLGWPAPGLIIPLDGTLNTAVFYHTAAMPLCRVGAAAAALGPGFAMERKSMLPTLHHWTSVSPRGPSGTHPQAKLKFRCVPKANPPGTEMVVFDGFLESIRTHQKITSTNVFLKLAPEAWARAPIFAGRRGCRKTSGWGNDP